MVAFVAHPPTPSPQVNESMVLGEARKDKNSSRVFYYISTRESMVAWVTSGAVLLTASWNKSPPHLPVTHVRVRWCVCVCVCRVRGVRYVRPVGTEADGAQDLQPDPQVDPKRGSQPVHPQRPCLVTITLKTKSLNIFCVFCVILFYRYKKI
jgi:hypothetical protein